MFDSSQARHKKQRDPPPSLFFGPPPQNESPISIPSISSVQPPPMQTGSSASRVPLSHKRSFYSQQMTSHNSDGHMDSAGSSHLAQNAQPKQNHDTQVRKQADRTDLQWAEMQRTLEEVELSAARGAHVFGAEHANALEGLRRAQIELAKAWAKSEADDVVEGGEVPNKGLAGGRGLQALGSDGKSVMDTAGTTVTTGSGRPGSACGPAGQRAGHGGEERTESDILLARKRRDANDKYFKRVNDGVLDVVARLEEVARAMRAVERESRDVWGESELSSNRTSLHNP